MKLILAFLFILQCCLAEENNDEIKSILDKQTQMTIRMLKGQGLLFEKIAALMMEVGRFSQAMEELKSDQKELTRMVSNIQQQSEKQCEENNVSHDNSSSGKI